MRKLILVFAVVMMFTSCETKAQDKKGAVNKAVIEKVTPSVFDKVISKKEIQLVDVRTPQEYMQGHIGNAKNINLFDPNFQKNLQKLDKNKPVYVYCRSGHRSGKASKVLKKLGFKKVYDLKGGYLAWSNR